MGIREDAVTILAALATYEQTPDDPNRGNYEFKSEEMPGLTGLTPNRVNDGVEFLASRGLVELLRYLGTHPFTFGTITLTAEGRLESEKYTGVPQPQDTDKMLALLNRGKFDADLPRVLSQYDKTAFPVALCMLDIDHFKAFNDNYGHQSGDKVLQHTATLLRNIVGSKGSCYRYGGEELCVILPNYTRSEVEPLAERIRAGIENLRLDGLPQVTVSLGVAITETTGYEAKGLIEAADDHLYKAKNSGRNRIALD
jgi:diguanylate cyclase (GGDEF)-like protein